ncbi:serine hydrolase domain-containing protein [Leucobacter chironomi]|uniref:serine hydrolase domain-containing protein n=1 Tax=Leucobacter chironomi TaxID=491918 RepID=UPI0003F61B93|nr:serine hydrolase domain-containing protein [Leucobacter chironomi]
MPDQSDMSLEPLRARFDRIARRRGRLGAPQVLLRAPGVEFTYGDQSTPFHAASIGKLATGAIVLQLARGEAFGLDTGIDALLPAREIAGLFAPGSRPPTVLELLRHTSGAADYFEGDRGRRNGLVRVVAAQPDRVWTPAEMLDFAREHHRPVGVPGERFRYSDTGYVLLGRLIEEVGGAAYHEAVRDRIVEPLGLERTFLPGLTSPARGEDRLAPCYVGRDDLSASGALSCGWAGGGIAATPADLIAFSEALHGGRLVTPRELAIMTDVRSRVRSGIHYGAAMMELRFDGFSPLLRGLPRPVGHLGSLATYLFHDRARGAHLVMNFHARREISRAIRAAITVESVLGSR